MKTIIKYAALILIGFLIACYFTCDRKSPNNDERKLDSLKIAIAVKNKIIEDLNKAKQFDRDTLIQDGNSAESEAKQVTKRYHEKINRPTVLPDSTLEAMYRHITRE